jgi:SAM-dependent methyltransferase
MEKRMKPIISAVYKRELIARQPKLNFDKTGKERPAWIEICLPKDVTFLKARFKHRLYVYQIYLRSGLFLPIDYTKEEMSKFYDKWAESYDIDIKKGKTNLKEAEFIADLFEKYNPDRNAEILDLGAGTGILSEVLAKHGYKNITLVDFSQKMLNQAKKKKLLKNCKFIKADVRKMNLHKKFDAACSLFSFGSSSYFKKEEIPVIFNVLKNHLKKNAIFFTLGHLKHEEYEKQFKTLKSGEHSFPGRSKYRFYIDYFMGKAK